MHTQYYTYREGDYVRLETDQDRVISKVIGEPIYEVNGNPYDHLEAVREKLNELGILNAFEPDRRDFATLLLIIEQQCDSNTEFELFTDANGYGLRSDAIGMSHTTTVYWLPRLIT
ncbi:hypothetical protein, partial [Kitasatospora cinereorecta]